MGKLEDERQYVIVDKVTKELWSSEVYLSTAGAKTSYWHASERYCGGLLNRYVKTKFDDQDKYEIVKVKLVPVDE
jgi:hypothetical protein